MAMALAARGDFLVTSTTGVVTGAVVLTGEVLAGLETEVVTGLAAVFAGAGFLATGVVEVFDFDGTTFWETVLDLATALTGAIFFWVAAGFFTATGFLTGAALGGAAFALLATALEAVFLEAPAFGATSFFAAGDLAKAFLATGCLVTAFLAKGFFAKGFLAIVFFTAVFFTGAVFLVAPVLDAGAFLPTDLDTAGFFLAGAFLAGAWVVALPALVRLVVFNASLLTGWPVHMAPSTLTAVCCTHHMGCQQSSALSRPCLMARGLYSG